MAGNSVGTAYLTLVPKLDSDTSEINDELKSAGKKGGSSFADGFKAIAKAAIWVEIGKSAADLFMGAFNGYAKHEQLVGGVETLFGAGGRSLEEYAEYMGSSVDAVEEKYNSLMSAQETMFSNAANAYATAGMSANQYMETATSFAASLVSSLGGDTVEAARIADQAMVDMSDNANKMGSDMSTITSAYQAFAKQNYTLLDNLKLGYGGTASEMARLINDTGVMGETFIATEKNINEVGFDKIIEAIHIVQDEMGITGTTAKEAESTIEGSFNMMSAAFDNFLAGLGDKDADVAELTKTLVGTAKTYLSNLGPVVSAILANVGKVVADELPVILKDAAQMLIDAGPEMLEAAWNLFLQIVVGIIRVGMMIGDAIDTLIEENVLVHVRNFFSDMGQAGRDLIDGLVQGIGNGAEAVVNKIKEICSNALDAVKRFFGIKSPSRVMRQMGGFIGQGMALGITDSKGAVGDAMDGMMGAALERAGAYTLGMSGQLAVAGATYGTYSVYMNGATLNDDEHMRNVTKSFLDEIMRKGRM